jgi:DNA-binding MarR family transcriptional regulator
MFTVNGFPVEGEAGLVQLLDLAQREVIKSFSEAWSGPPPELRGSRYRVLSMVPDEGGRRLTDLAAIADMTKQAMGEFVSDLAEGGYVTIEPDPADRRAKLVRLTGRGREASAVARRQLGNVERLWAERLGADEIVTLRDLLARVGGVT